MPSGCATIKIKEQKKREKRTKDKKQKTQYLDFTRGLYKIHNSTTTNMSPLSGKSTRKPANSSTNDAESALPESTVTSSFNAVSEGDTAQKSDDCIPSSGTVGQFSFAPATQTTVVTTTTTTTTKFPPFVMRPPRFSGQLDPKVYPLASMPTPAPLRDIRFVLNGKSVIFHEADDVPGILSKVRIFIRHLCRW